MQEKQEMWVWSLGWEDPLEYKRTTHFNILARKIPEELGGLQSMGSQRVWHNWACMHAPVVQLLSHIPPLWPYGLQHARLLCPLSPRVCSNSCPLSQWYYLSILCCPLPLPSIFPSIRVFSNELAICIRWPASASVLPMNIQGWFLLGLTGLISLQSKGLSKVWVGFHFLLQRIFSTQRWNPCFLHWHSLLLSHQGSPYDF